VTARARTVVVAGVACLAVALPTAAEAKTKTVAMGLPNAKTTKKFNNRGTDVNDFFPHGTTIHVGDTVKFVPTGFHTVDLPAKGGRVNPFVAPQDQLISGANDEAGQPFWFNGQPNLGFNPVLITNQGYGKKLTYNGKKAVLSGLQIAPKNKPMKVKFAKAGNYTYFCNLHPGMKGVVHVRAASKKVPSAKADKAVLAKQVSRDFKIAKGLANTIVPAKTVFVGSAGPHGVEYFGMFPLKGLTVHVGDSVNFQMSKGSFEDHTASFGPGDPATGTGYLGQIAATLQAPTFDPRLVYPSDAAPATYSSTTHGNGFWSTGVLDRSNATPLPARNSVTFGVPGTYKFYCLIHPFMVGTVNVTP
jgi:plastocyanin